MTTATVIIAAHNAELTIERAIKSAREQTLQTIEILVVDDKSADLTASIVSRASVEDPRVRLISSSHNLGPGFARNLAMSQANGEWIAVLDADDSYAPDRLERLITFAKRTGADLVSDNMAIFRPDGTNTGETIFPPTWIPVDKPLGAEAFVLGNIGEEGKTRLAYGFMKPVISRQFLTMYAINYKISRFAEDYILALQCLISGGLWNILPEALYHYTVSEGTLTNKRAETDMQALIGAEEALMAMPSVLANATLLTALSRHLTNTRKAVTWNAFAQSLKRCDIETVIKISVQHPKFFAHFVKETSRLGLSFLGRTMRQKRHKRGLA